MKKILTVISLAVILLLVPCSSIAKADYSIINFSNEIQVKQDRKLLIKEVVETYFPEEQHGIFRIIPTIYSHNGRTINSRLRLISVKDEIGNDVNYETSRVNQSVEIKIGDPNVYVIGKKVYIITYEVSNILQKYQGNYELYWNVTGNEWDTQIHTASSLVVSPHASIVETKCFVGTVGTTDLCVGGVMENDDKKAYFVVHDQNWGEDFTIVVKLDSKNSFVEPTWFEKFIDFIASNWGYLAAIIPFFTIFYFWYKKGRDLKYEGDNVYYKPEKAAVKTKGLFEREYLPMVYYPINGYSPAQIGTIIDEKVDIHDIVSEIIELARLKYLKIEKIEKKKFLGKSVDYSFKKLPGASHALNDYQSYLLDKIFDNETEVLLSSLKNNFYKHLDSFKKKLYESLKKGGIFDGNPDSVRGIWMGITIAMTVLGFIALVNFVEMTGNGLPFLPFFVLTVPTFVIAFKMPRRTPLGYSIYRQTAGLAYYLKSGKWRHEIAEKKLFFEEMLPLAISLEVVNRLAKDMKDLGVAPPSYFAGTTAGSLNSDLIGFRNTASSTFVSAPGGKWSGSSSWSGGSGFSGGSSGGGFGGGGGGSW